MHGVSWAKHGRRTRGAGARVRSAAPHALPFQYFSPRLHLLVSFAGHVNREPPFRTALEATIRCGDDSAIQVRWFVSAHLSFGTVFSFQP